MPRRGDSGGGGPKAAAIHQRGRATVLEWIETSNPSFQPPSPGLCHAVPSRCARPHPAVLVFLFWDTASYDPPRCPCWQWGGGPAEVRPFSTSGPNAAPSPSATATSDAATTLLRAVLCAYAGTLSTLVAAVRRCHADPLGNTCISRCRAVGEIHRRIQGPPTITRAGCRAHLYEYALVQRQE